MPSFPPFPKQIIVLGAGVTGLQTTLSLLSNPSTKHHKVTIIASHFPGDFSPNYTSPWAGGHWRSHATSSPAEALVREWDKRTYEHWIEMLKTQGKGDGEEKSENVQEKEKRIGLGIRESRNFWGKESLETDGGDGRGVWWRGVVEGFEVLDLKEKGMGMDGAVFGIRYQSVCINIPRYLEFLFERVKELGAKVVRGNVETGEGLEGVVKGSKRILLESEKGINEGDVFAFVNCTGLSARHFVGKEEAEKLFPIRGQTILVKGEAKMTRTYVSVPGNMEEELLYVVPRPESGMTILGGCKQVGNWSSEVDEEQNSRILQNVRKFGLLDDGELSTGEAGGFEIVSVQVGFRPGRKGGPRVELGSGNVDGVWVVHAYGHSGAGYQNSVGSAERVVGIISGLESKN